MSVPRTTRTWAIGAGTAAMALAGLLAVSGPVAANAAPEDDSTQAGLVLTGFNAEVAEANGFEIRTDADGWQCSVPAGVPEGLCPEDGLRLPTDGIAARGVVNGTCGYAWMYWNNSSRTGYEVGYQIYQSAGGAPLSHAWSASFETNQGPKFHNLTGTTAWGAWRWVHTGTLGGATGTYGETGGSVLLSNGSTCVSGIPRAT